MSGSPAKNPNELPVTLGFERRLDRSGKDSGTAGADDGERTGVFRRGKTVVRSPFRAGGGLQRSGQHMRSPGIPSNHFSPIAAQRNGVRPDAGPSDSVLPIPARAPRDLDRWTISSGRRWWRKPTIARSEMVWVLDRTLDQRWHFRRRDGWSNGNVG